MELHPEFVVDEKARRKAVILPIDEWESVLEALKMLEAIQLYDKAKDDESLDWAAAKKRLAPIH